MKNFSVIIGAVVFILCSAKLQAAVPQVDVSPPSEWINIAQWSNIPEFESNGPIRYIFNDEQINLTTPQKQHYYRLTSKVLDEQGLSEISEIQVRFSGNYETLIFHQADLIRDGRIVKTLDPASIKVFQQETELQDNIYSQQWTALIILEDVRIHDVVDFSYTVVGSNPVFKNKYFGGNSLEWSLPIDASSFRLLSNTKDNVQVKVHGTNLTPTITKNDQFTETVLKQHAVEAIREEDQTPNWYTQYAYISYSEFSQWEDVNDWAFPLYQTHETLEPELINILQSLEDYNTQEIVSRSIQWIQDNIRYFGIEWGINSHAPSRPNETFRRRYGDCKDKALLMVAVLKHLGIEAYPALVSTTLSKSIPKLLPSPGAFNHVIVTFFVDNKQFWVDATMSNQRGHYTNMSFPDYKYALVVQPNTDKIMPISPANASLLTAAIQIEQQFVLNGSALNDELVITTNLTRWQADSTRSYLSGVGLNKATTSYHDYITRYFPNASVQEQIQLSDDNKNNIIVMTERYSAPQFADPIEGNRRFTTYAKEILSVLQLPNVRQRKTPFVLPYFVDITINTQIDITHINEILWLEEGDYSVAQNDWFDYSRSVSRLKNSVTVHHHYHSKKDIVEASAFADYTKLLDEIEKQLSYSFIYKKELKFKDNNERARNLIKNLMMKNK